MWSNFLVFVISLAAALRTDAIFAGQRSWLRRICCCSSPRDLIRGNGPMSFEASIVSDRLMDRSCLSWKKQLLVILLICRSIPSSGSKVTPRFLADFENLMQCSPICIHCVSAVFASCCLDPSHMNWVLSEFSFSRLIASTAQHFRCIPPVSMQQSIDRWRGSVGRVDCRRRTNGLQHRVK